MKEIMNVKNLSMAYEHIPVFKDLSFSVEEGSFVAVLGENGAGKSTLLKVLLGLEKQKSGSVEFFGIEKSDIGYLSQDMFIKRNFPASAFEIVLSGRLGKKKFFPFYNQNDRIIADESLRALEAEDLKNSCFYELSGGQQQRVLLARALAAAKRLLILDEPAKGLDEASKEMMYEKVNHLVKSHNMTVIMVLHESGSAFKYATHILNMKKDGYEFYENKGGEKNA